MTKHEIKNITFVLDGYPYNGSSSCVFARNLIVAIADIGINCTVITPQIITPGKLKKRSIPYFHNDISPDGNIIPVYAPMYVYFPASSGLTKLSMNNHYNAVLRTMKKEKINVDAIYGHFIFQCGLTVSRIGKELNIPSFLGAGESDKLMPGNKRNHGVYELGVKSLNWQKYLAKLSGIICVSEWTKKLLFDNGFLSNDQAENTVVFPNGVNQELFCPADKKMLREKLGLPESDFITLFVGAFNDNKGVLRVSEALKMTPDVKSVFLGGGSLLPDCNGILFCGSCSNSSVAKYMQAADCFILPTKSEGCCNAILEALSCGLPVISSDLPFNDGILNDSNSILIDPERIDSISDAIKTLKNDLVYRESLSEGAVSISKNLEIEKRAEKIVRFMSEVTEQC